MIILFLSSNFALSDILPSVQKNPVQSAVTNFTSNFKELNKIKKILFYNPSLYSNSICDIEKKIDDYTINNKKIINEGSKIKFLNFQIKPVAKNNLNLNGSYLNNNLIDNSVLSLFGENGYLGHRNFIKNVDYNQREKIIYNKNLKSKKFSRKKIYHHPKKKIYRNEENSSSDDNKKILKIKFIRKNASRRNTKRFLKDFENILSDSYSSSNFNEYYC